MSSMGDTLRLRESLADKFGERELRPQRFRATMGDGTGAVTVPGKPNYVYVRRLGRGRIEECLNNKAAARDGLPIIAGYSHEMPEVLQVLEVDWPSFSAPGDYSYIQHHHEAHELHNDHGGDDVVWVQSQQIMPLLVYPTDPATMTVNVFAGWYPWDDGWHYFESTVSAGFGGHVPALPAQARYVLISIDGATEALQYTDGNLFPVFIPPVDAENMLPAPPAGSIPIGAVYLVFGTTEIAWDELFDMRLFNQPVGGSILPGPHALLDSTVHSDTVTNAPLEGSIIVGNATPLWDELVHPGAAGYALVSGAADTVWDQTPTWTGSHTFNAGLTIPAGQGIVLTDDTSWIGLGAAAGRLVFEDIVGDEARFENCTYVGIDNVLRHNGDPDTYMIFSPDFCGFRVGGADFLYMDENGVDEFEVNPGGADIDFIVQAVGVADALLVQGSDGQITLGALTAGFVKSSAAGVLSVAAEVALAELAGYVRGSIIRGGAADWEALALAGAAGYALISTATDIVWDQTPAWTGRHSFAAGITFNGGAGINSVIVPDLADAFDITDASGTEFLRLDTSANAYLLIDPAAAGIKVGIGTLAPAGKVHVYETAAYGYGVFIDCQGTVNNQHAAFALLTLGDGTKSFVAATLGWSLTARGNAYITAAQQNDLLFQYWDGAAWHDWVYFDHAGNVGIGTTSPGELLSVDGHITLKDEGWYKIGGATSGSNVVGMGHVAGEGMYFDVYKLAGGGKLGANSMDAMVIRETTGHVGIGTTAPGARLEVNGDATDDPLTILDALSDNDSAFINFKGVSAADNTKSIAAKTSGWTWQGGIKIQINGADAWVPFMLIS